MKIIINFWFVFLAIATVIGFLNDVLDMSKNDFFKQFYKPIHTTSSPFISQRQKDEIAKQARMEYCEQHDLNILCRPL